MLAADRLDPLDCARLAFSSHDAPAGLIMHVPGHYVAWRLGVGGREALLLDSLNPETVETFDAATFARILAERGRSVVKGRLVLRQRFRAFQVVPARAPEAPNTPTRRSEKRVDAPSPPAAATPAHEPDGKRRLFDEARADDACDPSSGSVPPTLPATPSALAAVVVPTHDAAKWVRQFGEALKGTPLRQNKKPESRASC